MKTKEQKRTEAEQRQLEYDKLPLKEKLARQSEKGVKKIMEREHKGEVHGANPST